MPDTTPQEQLALYRSDHRIFLVEERHPDFGLIHRCETDMIRVHATRNGRWFHDPSEVRTLLDQNYGGPWGGPKLDPSKEQAIERIIETVAAHEDDDEEAEYDREGDPAFNGAFR
jgi:hypothetical protein